MIQYFVLFEKNHKFIIIIIFFNKDFQFLLNYIFTFVYISLKVKNIKALNFRNLILNFQSFHILYWILLGKYLNS